MAELEEGKDQKSEKPSSYIPIQDIYKVNVLNSDGQLERIHVFCANTISQRHLPEIFSDVQLAYYSALEPPVDIEISEYLIHKEDTIQMVKKKIVQELSRFANSLEKTEPKGEKLAKKSPISVALDELYLFTSTMCDIDMKQIYQEATHNDSRPLTKEQFFQYALNINANPFDLEDMPLSNGKGDVLASDTFSYEKWNSLSKSGIKEVQTPLGLRFQNQYDYLFSANPFAVQVWTEPIRFEISPRNPMYSFEHSLLLNFGRSTDITVCLAKNVLEHAVSRGISQEYMCQLYFPNLHKRGILGLDTLEEAHADLLEETAKKISPGLLQYYDTLGIFHEIYWARKPDAELPYLERGIRTYSITLKPGDFKHILPLDLLFKNIHASKDMPFIKYNPGNRRENMYRLYSTQVSANGKKIPHLEESDIMRLSRETGRGHQISMYLTPFVEKPKKETRAKKNTDQDVYIHIDANSHIKITGELTTLLLPTALDTFLLKTVNPIIDRLNGLLQSTGYVLRKYEGLNGPNVESALFSYQAVLPIVNTVTLQKQITYITSAFDVISTDVEKGAVLRFKRVENFKEMDAQAALITEIYQRMGHYQYVVQALMENYGLSQEDALLRLAQYSSEHQQLNGKILENPGFPTMFKMRPGKKELVVNVNEIVSSEYVDVLHTYIDTILRMTQNPYGTDVPIAKLKRFKGAKSKAEVEAVAQEMAVEDVVVPVGLELSTNLYKVQPLNFGDDDEPLFQNEGNKQTKEEISINNVEEGTGGRGLVFDDDYGFESDEDLDNEVDENLENRMLGGAGDTPSPELEAYQAKLDGMSIKQPTPFFKKMKELDPTLYITDDIGKDYKLYSKACPSSDKRQPIILTDEEKAKIDNGPNKGSYGNAIHYGSNPDKKYWYVCPRYWCLKTNSSISEADVKAGKCGGIIPRNASVVPPGSYVYEFDHPKQHRDAAGNYVQNIPGFLDKDKGGKHPDGLCIPCCFKKEWNAKQIKERREQCTSGVRDASPGPNQGSSEEEDEEGGGEVKEKVDVAKKAPVPPSHKATSYIISAANYPVPDQRWGFLPMAVQLFLGFDNSALTDEQNPALIRPYEPTLLRYGVENSADQSFIACMAYFYAYKHNRFSGPDGEKIDPPSIAEMRSKLAQSVSFDMFIRYHNGNLATIFRPKKLDQASIDIDRYQDSEFYKSLKDDLQDETKMDYLEETIAAYENFLQYLQDDKSTIDHTYLWDIVCDRNPLLMRDGINLVILKLADNDITEKVQMVCPSNTYSSIDYNDNKETIILVKQEGYYEPIFLYEELVHIGNVRSDEISYTVKKGETIFKDTVIDQNRKVVYRLKPNEVKKSEIISKSAFLEGTAIQNIKTMLKLIKQTSKKYCAPLASMPRVYRFKRNLPVLELIRLLKQYEYRIEAQVVNYRNKSIGIRIAREEGQQLLFVPCYPSGIVEGLEIDYMDQEGMWLDYRTTRDRLLGVSLATRGKVPCKPAIKIVEDNLVVGFLTETNQFVQIFPPVQNLDEDGIEVVHHSSYVKPVKNNVAASLSSAVAAVRSTIGSVSTSSASSNSAVSSTSSNNSQTNGNDASAEKILATAKSGDSERIKKIQEINLETQFYNVFRSLVRLLLNNYEYRQIRKTILKTIEDRGITYHNKLGSIVRALRELTKGSVSFQDFDEATLMQMDNIIGCSLDQDGQCANGSGSSGNLDSETKTTGPAKKYCLTTADGVCQTIFPKTHLLSGSPNERVYYDRMADELLRYGRIRQFMFHPKTYLNVGNAEFKIRSDELFLLESLLNKEYFQDLTPYNIGTYVENIEYDTAKPAIAQTYANDVSLDEQAELIRSEEELELAKEGKTALSDYIVDCLKETKSRVIGNEKAGSWRPYFPNTVKEMVFGNSIICSFIPMIYILQEYRQITGLSVQNVKTALWNGYRPLMEIYQERILTVLRNQGKRDLMDLVTSGKTTLERAIFSESYYITDLDWWVLCQSTQLPVVLFSSTTLKYLVPSINWLRLSTINKQRANERFFFVRSPVDVRINSPPGYHVLMPALAFSEMRGEMFLAAERGDPKYLNEIQSLETFLAKKVIVFARK